MKKTIDVFDYAGPICKAMKKGVLLTTRSGDAVNTMTIGWGTIGIEWNKPIFIAYVRESRYTRQLLEESGEFTVNIPWGELSGNILGYCGTKSGRDTDKLADLGLTPVNSELVGAPGIRELPLTLECKVICQQKQEPHLLPEGVQERFYPPFGEEGKPDNHIAYYGEIVNAYLITE